MTKIILPNNWTPRPYQRDAWDALTRTHGAKKRALLVWHRRAGKDDVCLHLAACKAMQRTGNYWHMLPEYGQARKSVWEAVNPHRGSRRIDEAFPNAIRDAARNNDMFMRLKGGSTWQLVGSDSYNSLVGSPPIGVTASEWALADPSAWAYMRPILRENGGWAAFITTPRGSNHVKKMYDAYKDNQDWFVQKLSWRDTGVLTQEQAETELAEYCLEYGDDDGTAMFEQEWECNFDAASPGSYYANDLKKVAADGRLSILNYNDMHPVNTTWDLGVSDSTIIYYWQKINGWIYLIDRDEGTDLSVAAYCKMVKSKPYNYGQHFFPHDARNRDKGSALTYLEQAASNGLFAEILSKESIIYGINLVHQLFKRMIIDHVKLKNGMDAWKAYRKTWNSTTKQFDATNPVHDWASHDADVLRYIAMAESKLIETQPASDKQRQHDYGASNGWMR